MDKKKGLKASLPIDVLSELTTTANSDEIFVGFVRWVSEDWLCFEVLAKDGGVAYWSLYNVGSVDLLQTGTIYLSQPGVEDRQASGNGDLFPGPISTWSEALSWCLKKEVAVQVVSASLAAVRGKILETNNRWVKLAQDSLYGKPNG